MQESSSTAGSASLLVDGDPAGCRAEAARLRSLSSAASRASDLFTSYGTAGISGFLGETATVFQSRCSTDPGSQTVAERAVSYAAGLERLADDLVEVRHGMDEVREVARRHGLPLDDASVKPPPPGEDAAAAWEHVCRLLAWHRRRERAAQQRWLGVLDRADGRAARPVEDAGPRPVATFPADDRPGGHLDPDAGPATGSPILPGGANGATPATEPVGAAGPGGSGSAPTGDRPGQGQPGGHAQPADDAHHLDGPGSGLPPSVPVVTPTSTGGAPVAVIPDEAPDGVWVAQTISPASWVAVAWEACADTAPAVLGTGIWRAR